MQAGSRNANQSGEELLLKDLDHFGESMWRNEEIGEKRFSFFLSLITAVTAGLVALATAEVEQDPDFVEHVTVASLAALSVIGILTYLRMVRRNRVTDEHQRTLKYIRGRYALLYPRLRGYRVPVKDDSADRNIVRGGYAETVGVIEGALVGSLIALTSPLPAAAAVTIGASLAVVLSVWALKRDKADIPAVHSDFLRAGVGAMILNRGGLALVLERADIPGAWQLPQGGLEKGEEPESALWREIREETGIRREDLVLRGRYPELLAYELPPPARNQKTGRGQAHYWFVLDAKDESPVQLPEGGEFRDWRWQAMDQLAEEAVDFRRAAYEKLANYVRTLPSAGRPAASDSQPGTAGHAG